MRTASKVGNYDAGAIYKGETASKIGNYEAVTLYKKGTASIRAIFDAVPDKSSKLLQLPAPAVSSNRYP